MRLHDRAPSCPLNRHARKAGPGFQFVLLAYRPDEQPIGAVTATAPLNRWSAQQGWWAAHSAGGLHERSRTQRGCKNRDTGTRDLAG